MSFFSKQAFQEDEDSDIEYTHNDQTHTNWNLQSVISQHASSTQATNANILSNLKESKSFDHQNGTNILINTRINNSNSNSNSISMSETAKINNDLRNLLPNLNETSKKRKLDEEMIDKNSTYAYRHPSKKAKISNENDKLLSILKSRFGFSSFRNKQRIAIESCLNGNDVLLVMPTGSGKSICFQIIPLITNKIGIIISPLISLMKNHVDALKNNNINAVLFNSSISNKEKQNILQLLENKIKTLQQQRKENKINNNNNNNDENHEIDIFYTSPETLNSNMQLKSRLKSLHFLNGISLFAIDECHCISSWGHDFRPKYRLLNQIGNNFPNIPIMAVTATATKNVQNDIIQSLKLNNPNVIIGNFDRPNLYFKFKYYEQISDTQPKQPFNWKKFKKRKTKSKDEFISRENRIFAEDVKQFISEKYPNSCGIIYTFSRKAAEQISSYLQKNSKLSIEAYHAGFGTKYRKNVQEKWESDEIKIICSTNAFGMGIDKSNVRFIIHNVITQNMESYYQQIGRAGRDGKYSDIICYYSRKMTNKLRKLIFDDTIIYLKRRNVGRKWERGELKRCVQNCVLYKHRMELLERIKMFAEGKGCRRKYILQYFGSNVSKIGTNSNNNNYKCCDYCHDSESINVIINQYNQMRKTAGNKKRFVMRKRNEMRKKQFGNVLNKRGKKEKKRSFDNDSNNSKNKSKQVNKQTQQQNHDIDDIDDNDKKFTFENVFGC